MIRFAPALEPAPLEAARDPTVWPDLDMAEYPRFDFRMREVKRAGEIIADTLLWTEESAPGIMEAYRIANNWRDAHTYPMRSMRGHLLWYMRHLQLPGVTGARVKRMQAIRRKLRRVPENLSQLQDLGGCRVVLESMPDVDTLVAALRDGSRHHLRKEDPYILRPKPDGYRSHHMMFSYRGKGLNTVYDNRRIEVQLRTRLQHSWATAVEAVGLLRHEYLKNDQGNPDWLRLFLLMSAEFARAEGCAEPPDVPDHWGRIKEIQALNVKLKASQTLDNLSYAVHFAEFAAPPVGQPMFYLLRFDNIKKEVTVQAMFSPRGAASSYDIAESAGNKSGVEEENIVLVEADKIENVKAAYPNYFGDVQLFKDQLNRITKGKDVTEFSVRRQETVPPKAYEKPDLSWLRSWRRWK